MSRYPLCISGVLAEPVIGFPALPVGFRDPIADWQIQRIFARGPAGSAFAGRRARVVCRAAMHRERGRSRPFTVRFDVPQAPLAVYTLRLSLLADTPRLPLLELSVNGKRGRPVRVERNHRAGQRPREQPDSEGSERLALQQRGREPAAAYGFAARLRFRDEAIRDCHRPGGVTRKERFQQ